VKQENGRPRRLLIRILALLTVGILAASAGTASAGDSATESIEGVWSFNGGKIAIHPEGSGGVLVGTVLAPTTFAACPHEIGESIWSGLKLQPDGSYWGSHQWFYEDGSCTPNPQPGPTAFRVMSSGSSRFLRVCLSEPGSSQPTIGSEGKSAAASFGCVDSELIAGLPTEAELSPSRLISLQGNSACLAASRKLRIHIHEPGNGRLAVVDPSTFGSGSFVVAVTLKTALGHTIKRKRTYRACLTPRHQRKPHGKNA
jgi:hypothetical protein